MEYRFKTKVRVSETDYGKGLSPLGAGYLVEDAVCALFAEFERDNVVMKRDFNSVWVFVKNKFRFYDYALWNEEITVSSYFVRKTAVSLTVETAVENCRGEIALIAKTEVCLIDLLSQKIRRIAEAEIPAELNIRPAKDGADFKRFSSEGFEKAGEFTVPSTAIDYCMHLNNVEYLRFILNTDGVEYGLYYPVSAVELQYLLQAREGEELTVCKKVEGTTEYFSVCGKNGTAVRCVVDRGKREKFIGL